MGTDPVCIALTLPVCNSGRRCVVTRRNIYKCACLPFQGIEGQEYFQATHTIGACATRNKRLRQAAQRSAASAHFTVEQLPVDQLKNLCLATYKALDTVGTPLQNGYAAHAAAYRARGQEPIWPAADGSAATHGTPVTGAGALDGNVAADGAATAAVDAAQDGPQASGGAVASGAALLAEALGAQEAGTLLLLYRAAYGGMLRIIQAV